MNSSCTFCCLFLGLILIISQSPLSANARELPGGELVDGLCSSHRIEDKNKIACKNILGSNPEAMKAKDYYDISVVVITMAYNKAVEGQKYLKGLAAKNKSLALTDCADSYYASTVDYFKDSIRGLNEDDPEVFIYNPGRLADYPRSCEDELASEHIVNPQITALHREIGLLNVMAGVATHNISPFNMSPPNVDPPNPEPSM